MAETEDLFDANPEYDQFVEDYERRRNELFEQISMFMEGEEFDEAYAAQLLLDMAIDMRMTAYGMNVEQPSIAGLKLDLDRFRGEVDSMLRHVKKNAEDYIQKVKEARASDQAEDDSK